MPLVNDKTRAVAAYAAGMRGEAPGTRLTEGGTASTSAAPAAPSSSHFVAGRGAVSSPDEASAPSYMRHKLTLFLPLPSLTHATNLARVLSVDKPLRHYDCHIHYVPSPSPVPSTITSVTNTSQHPTATLQIVISTTTVRQLRLAANSLLEDARLVVDTMEAFPGPGKEGEGEGAGGEKGGAELELGSTGRAG